MKTYVITGSTSGIGKAFLEKIASNSIVFAGYRKEADREKLELISKNVFPFYIDYSKAETIKPAADFILSKTNKIDRLVNIAGCVAAGPMESIEISEIKRQFNVNVFGHLEFTQSLMSALEGGRIINISSMASFGIFPFVGAYCASKRCLDMLFNTLLIENKSNIEVVSIKPGVIATPLWGKSIEENSKYFDNFKNYSDEMQYVIKNAKKNEISGMNVEKVVEVLIKADNLKKPKLSYTVGKDAFAASMISKLPQTLVNKIIKFGIKTGCKK